MFFNAFLENIVDKDVYFTIITLKEFTMALRLNDIAPNFDIETTAGSINFHKWMDNKWCVLFSHPKDFTPVCTTELGELSKMINSFNNRNCKIIGLSVDSLEDHLEWIKDIEEISGKKLKFPIISDERLLVAKLYDMLPKNEEGDSSERTAQDNLTVRSVFLIGPDKRIKMSLTYPMSTGRNFNEVLRVLDSCQLTANYKVATPANWNKKDDVIIVPSITNDEAKKIFPEGWKTVKPYLRKIKDPSIK